MKKVSSRLDKAIGALESRVSSSITGSLIIRENASGIRCFRNEGSDHQGEYLGKDKKATLAALAQKRYDKELLKSFKIKKSSFDKAFRDLEKSMDFGGFQSHVQCRA